MKEFVFEKREYQEAAVNETVQACLQLQVNNRFS